MLIERTLRPKFFLRRTVGSSHQAFRIYELEREGDIWSSEMVSARWIYRSHIHGLGIFPKSSARQQGYLQIRQADGSYATSRLTTYDLARDGMVCIRFNNYWCVKSANWQGEIEKDSRDHAQFRDPVSGARAFARLMSTSRYSYEFKTINQIVARYAPSDDCVGSTGKPPNCPYGINPVKEYADQLATAVAMKASDDLRMFDRNRRLNLKIALRLFVAFSQFELTTRYRPENELILSGIRAAGLLPTE